MSLDVDTARACATDHRMRYVVFGRRGNGTQLGRKELAVKIHPRQSIAAILVVSLTALLIPGVASAQGGDVGGRGFDFYLNDSWSGTANRELQYAGPENEVYVGDWFGRGHDGLAAREGRTYYLKSTLETWEPYEFSFVYGRESDEALVGQWGISHEETVAVRRGREYHFKKYNGDDYTYQIQHYGRPGDTVLVGDWDGDGVDTLAVRRGRNYYIRNDLNNGPAELVVAYGRESDQVLVGDWDGDGIDTLAVRRANRYFVKNSLRPGDADYVQSYGRPSDTAFAGDWDGDGYDTLGVRRDSGAPEPDYYDLGLQRLLGDINAYRSSLSLPPLQRSFNEEDNAYDWAEYSYWWAYGQENPDYTESPDAERYTQIMDSARPIGDAVQSWSELPEFEEKLSGDYTHVGIAYLVLEYGVEYYSIVFSAAP